MSRSYKLGIIGSTHFNDKQLIMDELDRFVHANGVPSVVNSTGHKQGIELIVSKWCRRRGYRLVTYMPRILDTDEAESIPGFNIYNERNKDIVAASDIMLGFCIYNKSFKTMATLREAKTWLMSSPASNTKQRKIYTYMKAETERSRKTPSPLKLTPVRKSVAFANTATTGKDLSPLKPSFRYPLKNKNTKRVIFSSTRLSFAPSS